MSVTQETLDLMKTAQASSNDNLAKSITVGTGLVAYDLQGPAKNLYPVITPLRNSIPRVGGGTGTATNWRQISAITGSGVSSMPWVPEGQRSGRMSYTTANKAAAYVTIGEEDQISMEAVHAGRNFEDLKSTSGIRLLQQMMIKEEHAILGGNNSVALGTPVTPTLSSSGTGATLPSATYGVYAVALTYEGLQAASLAGGVKQAVSVTGADGLSYTVNGGSSQKSAQATQAVTLGASLFCSTTAVSGASGYAWFVGVSGSEKLEAITTINSAKFSAPLTGTGQAITAVTIDASQNSGAFDGLLSAAAAGGYVTTLATGTAGTGTALTASGRGSIVEIDAMLKSQWDNYRVSPTVLYMNAQELNNVTTKVLSNASGPLLRYNMDANGSEPMGIVAGGVITFYFNPFALNGGMMIPVKLHPTLPAGTILAYCENLPLQYQSNNVPNVCEVKTRNDYYQIDWPQKTRQYEFGVYSEEVLAIYAPFAISLIKNIANG
jgi:hypothetical protein